MQSEGGGWGHPAQEAREEKQGQPGGEAPATGCYMT